MVLNKLCLCESNKDTFNKYKIIYLTTALILDTNTHYTHINVIPPHPIMKSTVVGSPEKIQKILMP